jgi:hypothetical protein
MLEVLYRGASVHVIDGGWRVSEDPCARRLDFLWFATENNGKEHN